MKRQVIEALAVLLLLASIACEAGRPFLGENVTPRQRQILAEVVQQNMAAARPFVDEKAQPYFDAAGRLVTAFMTDEDGFDYADAFKHIRAAQPLLQDSLIRAGRTPEQTAAIVSAINTALASIEFALAGAELPPPEVRLPDPAAPPATTPLGQSDPPMPEPGVPGLPDPGDIN